MIFLTISYSGNSSNSNSNGSFNKLTKCSTHLYKATNKKNSHIKFDRASELIIGGNLGMEYDTDELILTGYDDGNAPIVPLDYHNYIRMKKN